MTSTCPEHVSTGAGYIDMAFDPNRPSTTFRTCRRLRKQRQGPFFGAALPRAALAELHVSGTLIPNQAMLINSIPLLGARASSEIENIVTTADRLFRHANDATGRADPAFCLMVTGPTGCPPVSAAR